MWDLAKFDTTPFFIGYCEKGYRDNSLTVIGSFSACDEFRGTLKHGVPGRLPLVWWDGSQIHFFSDAGKSLELKRIIFQLCEVVVVESNELQRTVAETATRNLLVKTETFGCLPRSAKLPRMFRRKNSEKGDNQQKKVSQLKYSKHLKSRDKTTAVNFCSAQRFQHL